MKPTKEELEQYADDKTAAAKKFGVTVRTIYRWMNEYGLCKCKNYGPKLNQKKATFIRARAQRGDSLKEIASDYKITLTAVYRIVNNVTYRAASKDLAEISVIYKVS